MEKIGKKMAEDHTQRSPHCESKVASEVKIPMTGTERVGGPTVQ